MNCKNYNQALISVIVPVYNVEKYLKRCLDSIINQDYKNLEIIIVDDGSTDDSLKICYDYANLDSRVVVIHKENGGLSSARNVGLDLAHGEYIGFIDSDDYIESNMYSMLKKSIDTYGSDISVCNYNTIYNNSIFKKNFSLFEFNSSGKDKFINIHNEYSSISIIAWNKLYKKSLFDSIRYPYGKLFEDKYIVCDLYDLANSISYILYPLYNHVVRNDSIINSFNIKRFDWIGAFDSNIDFYKRKGYYDLVFKEEIKKYNILLDTIINLKIYKIIDNDFFILKYNELLDSISLIKMGKLNLNLKLLKIFKMRYVFFKYIWYKYILHFTM